MERFSKRSREIRGRMAEVAERINRERARLGLEPVTAVSAEALDLAARQTGRPSSSTWPPRSCGPGGGRRQKRPGPIPTGWSERSAG
ncbi:MAG TPA: hypothetical protein VFD49_20730 [Candidatus Dormibacteraeota bacterium]|nr:hypothetical protein [Candidatus Dormibacteraeota bacterium]